MPTECLRTLRCTTVLVETFALSKCYVPREHRRREKSTELSSSKQQRLVACADDDDYVDVVIAFVIIQIITHNARVGNCQK